LKSKQEEEEQILNNGMIFIKSILKVIRMNELTNCDLKKRLDDIDNQIIQEVYEVFYLQNFERIQSSTYNPWL